VRTIDWRSKHDPFYRRLFFLDRDFTGPIPCRLQIRPVRPMLSPSTCAPSPGFLRGGSPSERACERKSPLVIVLKMGYDW